MLRRLNAGKTKKVCAIIKIKQVIFVSVLSLSQLYDRDMNIYHYYHKKINHYIR